MHLRCEKHNVDLRCLGGASAHDSNWYCEQCDEDDELVDTSEVKDGWKWKIVNYYREWFWDP